MIRLPYTAGDGVILPFEVIPEPGVLAGLIVGTLATWAVYRWRR